MDWFQVCRYRDRISAASNPSNKWNTSQYFGRSSKRITLCVMAVYYYRLLQCVQCIYSRITLSTIFYVSCRWIYLVWRSMGSTFGSVKENRNDSINRSSKIQTIQIDIIPSNLNCGKSVMFTPGPPPYCFAALSSSDSSSLSVDGAASTSFPLPLFKTKRNETLKN